MRRSNNYQIALITLLALTAVLYWAFFKREIFPEYRIYQDAYVSLENFRQSYSGETFAPFEIGIKQILLKEGKGPEEVDRCITCHVALDVEDYSSTRIKKDINGSIIRDSYGVPIQEKNPDYIFTKLDEKIADLEKQGLSADEYKALKTARFGDHVYDLEKVLVMHPLMGHETRPFEYHPENQYGCVSCHGGNGRGLTTEKAHGPVFDGDYALSNEGFKPQFLELDPKNDPQFSRIFNNKPDDKLLFQTTPILIGGLIEARCIQCHRPSQDELMSVEQRMDILALRRKEQTYILNQSLKQGAEAYLTLYQLDRQIRSEGLEKVEESYRNDDAKILQLSYLKGSKEPLELLQKGMEAYIGSKAVVQALNQELDQLPKARTISKFIEMNSKNKEATGSLFKQYDEAQFDNDLLTHFQEIHASLSTTPQDLTNLNQIVSDVDKLTTHYQRGKQLFIEQACYACHRIEGLSRGGIGPELTREGLSYPWFIKESLVWPQADLKSSQMPNQKLDHEELQDLMTFLLAQRGKDQYTSSIEKKEYVKAWENGLKLPFEKEINPAKLNDLDDAMMTFAFEGCASCHKLEGYTTSVGFKEAPDRDSFKDIYSESQWFKKLIPEDIGSSELVRVLEEQGEAIDSRIVSEAHPKGTLEMIEERDDKILPAFYAPFKYALRAKNFTQDEKQITEWKARVMKVMKLYYQEYGLGRLIGPRPNWSGIYRSDEWLMEHFWNPQSRIPRSLMPAFPFTDAKFLQLTQMLNVLGKQNRDAVRKIWNAFGFNPKQAYDIFCSQCHGDNLQGNGPVAPWIYPIPMNLRNTIFMQQFTKNETVEVIEHGVKGTPMPPWGEVHPEKGEGFDVPVLSEAEIKQLVEWIYDQLPGQNLMNDEQVLKWEYTPKIIANELQISDKNDENFKETPLELNDLFDVKLEHHHDEAEELYFIKEKFYTDQNLQAGKNLFLLHCSICHGAEGDGSGFRAESMQDAKPRVLTNVDWINAHDDLWILRAIKYGVPGTSMISFGDTTTPLQRIQIAAYVRSLSKAARERDRFQELLYSAFEPSEKAILQAKMTFAKELEAIKSNDEQAKNLLLKLEKLTTIKMSLEKEKNNFASLGNALVGNAEGWEIVQTYEQFLNTLKERYVFQDGSIKLLNSPLGSEKSFVEKMNTLIDLKQEKLKNEINMKQSLIPSTEREESMKNLRIQIQTWEKIKKNIQATFSENELLWEDQAALQGDL